MAREIDLTTHTDKRGKKDKINKKNDETNNDKDNIIGIWDEAGGDKDGAAGEEVAINA